MFKILMISSWSKELQTERMKLEEKMKEVENERHEEDREFLVRLFLMMYHESPYQSSTMNYPLSVMYTPFDMFITYITRHQTYVPY